MKDTIITGRRKKKELITLLICCLLANLTNVYAIFTYHTPATELITSIGYVAVATIFLYVVWSVLRLLFYGIKSILVKTK